MSKIQCYSKLHFYDSVILSMFSDITGLLVQLVLVQTAGFGDLEGHGELDAGHYVPLVPRNPFFILRSSEFNKAAQG